MSFQINLQDINDDSSLESHTVAFDEFSRPKQLSAVIYNLRPATKYRGYVTVLNGKHEGPASNYQYFTTANISKFYPYFPLLPQSRD